MIPEQRLRQRTEKLGGQLVRQVRVLLRDFEFKRLDDEAREEIELRLREAGLGVDPALDAVEPREFVVLYLLEREPGREPAREPSPETQAYREALEQAASGAHTTAVLIGAGVAGLGFTVLGFAGYWIYGVLWLAFTAFTLGLIRWRLPWLVRLFLPRLPFLRVGWSLGVAAMATVALVAGLLVMTPIASVRDAQAREREAKEELAAAERALAAGDLDAAERHLDEAREKDNSIARLSATERRLNAEREREHQYREAVESFEEGDYPLAINSMETLDGWREDVPLVVELGDSGPGVMVRRSRA